jgi:hypothetical protein
VNDQVGVLTVQLSSSEADQEELERLTQQLRRELLELDVETVERPKEGKPPAGAKGIELSAIGSLLVETATSSALLGAVVKVIQSWVAARRGRSVKIALGDDFIEVSGVSSDDQRRLIEQWIAAHAVD